MTAVTDTDTGEMYYYKYNDQGIRTEKIVDGVVHKYYLQGDKIIAERIGDDLLTFYYDATGVCGFRYYNKGADGNNSNGTDYYYLKNIFGDILGIYDDSGNVCAEYSYDAWGRCTIKGHASDFARMNPFRYRGYYYDRETGWYYLNSRYYDPEVGRFLSADTVEYLNPGAINGLNLYAYCLNNPVMYVDPTGTYVHIIFGALAGLIAGIVGQLISDALSGEWSTVQDYLSAAVGGAVGGAATALTGNVFAGAAIGSLTADAVTLGLNLLTGKEDRSPLAILNDTAINAVFSLVFAAAGPTVIGFRNTGKSVLKPLLKEIAEVTPQTLLYNIGEESVNSGIQSIFVFLLVKINRLIFWRR